MRLQGEEVSRYTFKMATQEALRDGLKLTRLQEGLEISGRTFDWREKLKSLGGRWNPEKKTWLLPADADITDLKQPVYVPVPREPYTPNMWAFDRLRDRRRRECCKNCKREFDEFNPQGPMWYVCSTHGKWKSDYDGT